MQKTAPTVDYGQKPSSGLGNIIHMVNKTQAVMKAPRAPAKKAMDAVERELVNGEKLLKKDGTENDNSHKMLLMTSHNADSLNQAIKQGLLTAKKEFTLITKSIEEATAKITEYEARIINNSKVPLSNALDTNTIAMESGETDTIIKSMTALLAKTKTAMDAEKTDNNQMCMLVARVKNIHAKMENAKSSALYSLSGIRKTFSQTNKDKSVLFLSKLNLDESQQGSVPIAQLMVINMSTLLENKREQLEEQVHKSDFRLVDFAAVKTITDSLKKNGLADIDSTKMQEVNGFCISCIEKAEERIKKCRELLVKTKEIDDEIMRFYNDFEKQVDGLNIYHQRHGITINLRTPFSADMT